MLVHTDFLRENPAMADPLSDILHLVDAQCAMSGGFHAGPRWAMRFPPPSQIKFSAMMKGNGWFVLPDHAPIRMETGDVVLINADTSFILTSDPSLEPRDATMVFANKVDGITRYDEGDDTFMLGGHVTLDEARGHLLRDVLPPVIHVSAASPEAAMLRAMLGQLVGEIAQRQPGSALASANLAQLMFVQVLRVHLESSEPLVSGWLQALTDQRIAQTLRIMHGDPGRAWGLEELAQSVNMSRTTFAERFKNMVGVAPLAYLTRWRMYLAERALSKEDTPIASLALSLGYTSESAFSHAFKRSMGMPPKRYRMRSRISDIRA
ncbi:AraC family transcriptional regulator [Dyella sp.]|uniref:AraC family transcriptional regulator n=1 Tax=Dyella sp. TaxID=1869338 RepID=UPI002ED38F90